MPPSVTLWSQLGDISNILKAFIGTNFLGMPFALSQSGIILGLIGLGLIVLLNDHCCNLIVYCKSRLLDAQVNELAAAFDHEDNYSPEKLLHYRQSLERHLTYSDIAYLTYGRPGKIAVDLSVFFTQFMFCVNYFIFIGNTIQTFLPVAIPPPNDTSNISSLDIKNFDVYDVPPANTTNAPSIAGPSLYILILFPLPFFAVFALIRRIRHLAPISFLANFSLLLGFISVYVYVILHLLPLGRYKFFDISTFPIFFGQVVSAFEGIGLIIPIEASMEANRYHFSIYLHGALFFLFLLYGSFGTVGYLHYGDHVNQLINKSIETGSWITTFVNITLLIAVTFTFPLQFFPVIEIVESYLFIPGLLCGGRRQNHRSSGASTNSQQPSVNNAESPPVEHSSHIINHPTGESVLRPNVIIQQNPVNPQDSPTRQQQQHVFPVVNRPVNYSLNDSLIAQHSNNDEKRPLLAASSLDDAYENMSTDDRSLATQADYLKASLPTLAYRVSLSGQTGILNQRPSTYGAIATTHGSRPSSVSSVTTASVTDSEIPPVTFQQTSFIEAQYHASANIPPEVPTWKRNILRFFLLLLCCSIAVPLRNNFAYVSAFAGAFGCTPLAYIFPCLIHFALIRSDSHLDPSPSQSVATRRKCSLIKDAIISCIGIIASLISMVVIIKRLIDELDNPTDVFHPDKTMIRHFGGVEVANSYGG